MMAITASRRLGLQNNWSDLQNHLEKAISYNGFGGGSSNGRVSVFGLSHCHYLRRFANVTKKHPNKSNGFQPVCKTRSATP